MKKCSVCKEEKNEDCFWKDKSNKDGLMYRCKDCDRKYKSIKRKNNPIGYKEKDKRYYQSHKQEKKKYNKTWRDKNWFKSTAHEAVKRALNLDIIQKEKCFCGNKKVDAHHEDYTKPLQVEWLCRRHHLERHLNNTRPTPK